jgi:hypothetical protein
MAEIDGCNEKKIKKLYCVTSNVFTTVTMKNAVFWDIKTQFLPHRRHITSPLQAHPVNAM